MASVINKRRELLFSELYSPDASQTMRKSFPNAPRAFEPGRPGRTPWAYMRKRRNKVAVHSTTAIGATLMPHNGLQMCAMRNKGVMIMACACCCNRLYRPTKTTSVVIRFGSGMSRAQTDYTKVCWCCFACINGSHVWKRVLALKLSAPFSSRAVTALSSQGKSVSVAGHLAGGLAEQSRVRPNANKAQGDDRVSRCIRTQGPCAANTRRAWWAKCLVLANKDCVPTCSVREHPYLPMQHLLRNRTRCYLRSGAIKARSRRRVARAETKPKRASGAQPLAGRAGARVSS